MTEPKGWQSPARKRQIAQGTIPANIAELEEKEVNDIVARILGKPSQTPENASAAPLAATPDPPSAAAAARRADRYKGSRPQY